MSQNIVDEVTFLFHSFLLGAVISFVYDGFIILRKLVKHNLFLISLEDLIFWIACAIGVFYMLYEENNGILRWFAVFGATLGMIAYKKTVSSLLVDVATGVIRRIAHIVSGIFRILFKPVGFAGKKAGHFFKASSRKGKRAGRCLKNKLTGRMKLLKITLCKH